MTDTVETLMHSLIQHGKLNNRIYLMDLDKKDYPHIFQMLDYLAEEKKYTKIFAKVPMWAVEKAKQHQYLIEATIPNFFNGTTDGYFLGKFLDDARKQLNKKTANQIKEVYQKFRSYLNRPNSSEPFRTDKVKQLTFTDAECLAQLYKQVFASYPFPIYDATYLKRMMNKHVKYYGIFEKEQLVAASAAEMDTDHRCVEMTDFATLPKARGKKYALTLLNYMDEEMKKKRMKT
ncbi:MAG: putative beta-lysine N-acetyltransferase, partial [Candidatus Thermoplasmatota archaeon]|nr:putative beta-lysine N-acetyltransferase [Candidatus Thermoplasmatota archaeon]